MARKIIGVTVGTNIKPEALIEKTTLATQVEQNKKDISQLSSEKVDKSRITLDKHTDGLIYIFIDGKPVGNGVEVTGEIVDGDVIGTLDENNNLLLSGDIADGTYTLKWLKDDGTYADAGNLVVSSITKYAINTTLSNCSASGATTINGGGSATVTITASSGYELPDTITVSGASHTWDKATGNIVLSNPTSDIYITVTAEKPKTNFAGELTVGRLSGSASGNIANDSTLSRVTEFVSVINGDIVNVQGYAHTSGNIRATLMQFNSSKTKLEGPIYMSDGKPSYVKIQEVTDTGAVVEITSDSVAYIRFGGVPAGSEDNIIVNIKRNGEWL